MAIQKVLNKDQSVSYKVRVRRDRRSWFSVKSFSRMIDAKNHEASLMVSKKAQGLACSNPDFIKMSFSDFWAKWKAECRTGVSNGWLGTQELNMRLHIAPHLGSLKLKDISPSHVSRVLSAMEIDGQSAQSRIHIYNLLRKMFGDLTEHFGVQLVSPVLRKHKPKQVSKERNYLKPEQSEQLLQSVVGSKLELPVALGLLCGMRISEIQGLRCEAIDFDQKMISIRSSYNKKTKEMQDHPKQGDWGSCPIPSRVVGQLKVAMQGKSGKDLVLSELDGQVLHYDRFLDALRAACKAAGVPVVSCHELRHSCTELWLNKGASTEDIRRLLNHKTLSVTQKYIHRSETRLKQFADLL